MKSMVLAVKQTENNRECCRTELEPDGYVDLANIIILSANFSWSQIYLSAYTVWNVRESNDKYIFHW